MKMSPNKSLETSFIYTLVCPSVSQRFGWWCIRLPAKASAVSEFIDDRFFLLFLFRSPLFHLRVVVALCSLAVHENREIKQQW
jgi:hypothetical protein